MPKNAEFFREMRDRFHAAKQGWDSRRTAYTEDLRYSVGEQWNKAVRDEKEDAGDPALTFNELHPLIQQCTNQVRQNRPAATIVPGDDSTDEAATMWEEHIRYIQYASQADVAYDTAVECSASGGFGFYRLDREYTDDGFNQEPRIKRILDSLTVLFDPETMEPDMSDAGYAFILRNLSEGKYKKLYNQKAVASFDDADETKADWIDGQNCIVVEYFWVDEEKRRKVAYAHPDTGDEVIGFEDDPNFQVPEGAEILNERDVVERHVYSIISDGQKELEDNGEFPCPWIPIMPALGREVIVDGKRLLISLIRFSKDPQKLLNACLSAVAANLADATRAPWTGPVGTFKPRGWDDQNGRYNYLEWAMVKGPNGETMPGPVRNTAEPAVQALTASAMQFMSAIQRSAGYMNSGLGPEGGQAEPLSGIAELRRQKGTDLVNFHFGDNLTRTQWHEVRCLLAMCKKLYDTPRALRTIKQDGKTFGKAPVTMDDGAGNVPQVPGFEGQTHHRVDQGRLDVRIAPGKSYDSRRQEGFDQLLQLGPAAPMIWQVCADIIIAMSDIPGAQDMAGRLKMMIAASVPGMSGLNGQQPQRPQDAQQIAQMSALLQKIMPQYQELLMEKKAKLIEGQVKLQTTTIKAASDVVTAHAEHAHDTNLAVLNGQLQAIDGQLQRAHEFMMQQTAPQPVAKGPVQ